MVQKTGKHGIRSGNTLRAINTKHVRRYRKEAHIVRSGTAIASDTHTHAWSDVLEGANISCKGVLYSLNKRHRWLLPELLKDTILHDDLATTNIDDVWCTQGIELVERHKFLRNNNSIGVYASPIRSKHGNIIRKKIVKVKEKGYNDADNILSTLDSCSRRKNRRKRFRELQTDDTEDVDSSSSTDEVITTATKEDLVQFEQNPPVRYEVIYPCELSSVLSLKSKHIGKEVESQFHRSPQKEKRWIYEDIKDALEEKYYNDNIDICGMGAGDEETGELNANKAMKSVHLADICNKFPGKNDPKDETPLTKFETDNKDQIQNKEHYQNKTIEAPSPIETTEEDKLVNNDNSAAMETQRLYPVEISADSVVLWNRITNYPVCVLLMKEEININSLQRHYAGEYLECRCTPRRFLLSISEYVNDLDGIGSVYKLLQLHKKKTLSWLVFVHNPTHKLNSTVEEAYNISLNARFSAGITNIRIEGLEENSIVSITQIIGSTLTYLKSAPHEYLLFETNTKRNKRTKLVNCNNLLEDMKNWSTCTYFPDCCFLVKRLIEAASESANTRLGISAVDNKLNGNKNDGSIDTCTICCKNADVESFALSACSHLFCANCWKAYMHENVNVGSVTIHCPESNCKEIVDIGTIISCLDVSDILTYARRRHDVDVENSQLTKWCSNEDCGRVVIINTSGVVIARCSCGETMCFLCNGKPHWPLACRHYLQYVNTLMETRDKDIIPDTFVMKFDSTYCRICYKILKRYDTCSITHCVCGRSLCQRCSLLWHSNNYRVYGLKSKDDTDNLNSVKAESQYNVLFDGKRTKWYKLAMKHRLQLHPYRIAKIQASSKLLANRIGHYILREERKYHFVSLDFVADDGLYLREVDKVSRYMVHIVDMYREINTIVENVSLFLDGGNDQTEDNESLHRRAMILSTCAKVLCDLLRDGAFMNPKVVIDKLKDICSEVRRVMESIVYDC